ncbi:hypothetical protein EZ449_15235 [Pedobacter frigidisoli]|uniref:histidine kinase n=1 Tax=Pedobacter frigidisoli TaxID=2530455 RepID=A0A4R0P522_9SPHI|nr:HAMP domain-containing sensor histidine kinase [Pedobacter frigidisoli]TCD07141.1 hypothetical protein EZ449_15235 [Pedobacter frigidisoli]
MKILGIAYVLSFFFFISCFGQTDKRISSILEKEKLCSLISAKLSGRSTAIDSLILIGNEGLKLTKAGEHNYRFAFHQAIGTGYYYKQNFLAASKQFELSYQEASNAGMIEKSLKPLGNLVSVYHYMGLQNKADEAARKLKLIAEQTDTLKSASDVYYNLGLYNQQQKFYYSVALEYFLKSLELHKAILDTTTIVKKKLDYGAKLMMVAEIYLYLKQPDKAIEYLSDIKPYLGLSIVLDVAVYGKFIRAYGLLNNSNEALKYYNLLHRTVEGSTGKWSELVSSNNEMAYLAMADKNYSLAKKYIDKADKQAKLDGNELLTSSVNTLYGDYYRATNNLSLASRYYKMSEPGALVYNKQQYAEVLQKLTEVEIKNGNKAAADAYFQKYVLISDSLNQRKISLNLAEMEARFQNKYKQQKIGVLNKENESKDIQLSQAKTTRLLLIVGASLLFIALFSIYINFRNKQKANLLLDKKNQQLDIINNQLDNANQTKTKLFSIISHDLRSPVSQLFTFLKLQQNAALISEDEKAKHQEKLILSSTNLLATMEDLLLWSKSQMESFKLDICTVDVNELFENSILLMKGQAEAKQIDLKLGELAFKTFESDENLLTIIIRNLLQNAINHSYQNSDIKLNAGIGASGNKYLSIVNKGDEISAQKIEELLNHSNIQSKSSGYGLLIVKELTQKLNASLNISSSSIQTEVTIVF